MSLLVEYSVAEGKAGGQIEALNTFTAALKVLGDPGFSYTAYETADPTRFIAVLDFDDEAAKDRFLQSDAFQVYKAGAGERFTGPPTTTVLTLVSSSRA